MTTPAGAGGVSASGSRNAGDRWCKRANVLERRLADGLLLLPLVGDDVTLVAATGGRLWDLLTEPQSTGELTEELARSYEGDANNIRSDIEVVLTDLERDGVVGRET
jgi:hypothetical protein